MVEGTPELNTKDQFGRTGLHNAVLTGDEGSIREILKYEPDRNIQDTRGKTPLHLAAYYNKIDAARLLLDQPAATVDIPDIHRQNALHIAAFYGNTEISQKLLDNYANPNAPDKNGQTPLHIAADRGFIRIVTQLLEKQAKSGQTDKHVKTPLHLAANKGFDAIVDELLRDGEAKADALDATRKTPLHLAAFQGHDRAVKVLLRRNEKIKDLQDKEGQPAIYYSALNGHACATKVLKDAKANTEISNGHGQTLLYQFASLGNEAAVRLLIDGPPSANINAQDIHSNPPLYAAAKGNHSTIVHLLVGRGADKQARDNSYRTMLHRAAAEGSESAVRLLLEIGPEKDAMDKESQTPLYVAARHGHKAIVKQFVDDNPARLNAKDSVGRTLLHRAATEGHTTAAEMLAGAGANLGLLDSNGRPPLYVAAECNHVDIVRTLRYKYKADPESRDTNGQTLLHRAAREANKTAANLLLKVEAEKNAKDNNGQTPLHIVPNHSTDVLSTLLQFEADPDVRDNNGQTPLHVVAGRGDGAISLLKLLIGKGKIGTMDNNGQTPLHAAAANGDVHMFSELLAIPAAAQWVDKADSKGQTAMHVAAQHGRHEIVLLLYTAGAKETLQDKEGETPLHTAAKFGKSEVVAVFRGLPGWEANRATKDKQDRRPFHLACLSKDQATINMLLDPQPYRVPPPQTNQQYHVHYRQFVADNLHGVFTPCDPQVKYFADEAAAKASAAARMWGLDQEDVPGLALLWLYDMVILCDDSGSMKKNPKRIDALNDTLQRAAKVATVIEPRGIYVRFLNYPKDRDGGFDHMTDAHRINKKVAEAYRADVGILTPLGTQLRERIVRPLVFDKIASGKFVKPLLVFIITDGQPEGEPSEAFGSTIRDCKGFLKAKNIGNAAVIFIVAQVGNSSEAKEFLKSLMENKDVRSMLHWTKGNLDEVQKGLSASSDEYTAWLVRGFIDALKSQSKARYNYFR